VIRLGVRGKLLAASTALILVIGAVTAYRLESGLRTRLEEGIEQSLLQQARLARELMGVAPSNTIEGIQPLAVRAGRAAEARVTIIGTDGLLWGDSELSPPEVKAAENHATRPECVQAAAEGWGTSRRYSGTLKTSMLYVCVPWPRADGAASVRVALPLTEVEATLDRARSSILGAVLAALLAALLLSGLASRLGRELDRQVLVLAAERDRFGTVLDAIRVGVVAVDRAGEVVIANPASRELLGVQADPTGRRLEDVPGMSPLVSLLDHPADADGELEIAGPPPRWLDVAVSRSLAGGAVAVLHDTTEVRNIDRIRRDFVANASHELRTPVTVLLSNTETLLDGALQDEEMGPRLVEAMHRHGQRLGHLLQDLLDLSRIEAGRYPTDIEPLPARETMRDVVLRMSPDAAKAGLALGVEEGPEVMVAADEGALDQVLANLVGNALKFTPAGGGVLLRCVERAKTVRLEVSDDGPGIAPEHRSRLFERFYRVDAGRSRSLGGTGLGLAIVKHLTQSMGGAVGMEPNEPTGSRFWVELPRAGGR